VETIKIRGLARLAAAMFAGWGGLVLFKGAYDLFLGGQPEANLFAPEPWAFVTREQWARYAVFECVYGLSCLALAYWCVLWSRRLPKTVRRPRRKPEFALFD
jgi:hypothetical protein